MDSSSGRASDSSVLQRDGSVLVEAWLQGGAPWGFTLKGGLEHGEALIISKVEHGGKADSLEHPLLVGDEILIINEIELTGFRQEAISLVKGSYKTLQLTVRRRSEPASRPHSWHSTKLGEGQQEPGGVMQLSQGGLGTVGGMPWHHNYHASASTTDLSAGFESGGGYLRKSPDQYSSRGSMESLDPPQPSHHQPSSNHHHGHGGPHPAYSSCHQLSSSRSSNSIDHLHSKRDSAYSSFSTSSSIPEYLAAAPSFSPERSYSLETVPQRGGGEMHQADIRYVRTVYDPQQGLSQEQELSSASAALLRNSDQRSGGVLRSGPGREFQGSGGGVCYRGNSSSSSSSSGSSNGGRVPASNRHSVGPIWAQAASHSSQESLKGAPAPPQRSDSYAAIRNHERHERPNSWSSQEQTRSLRSLQKGSWHHSSGSVASGKGSFVAEGQLHTVIEKSPESSPTTKPRQGVGGFTQPSPPPGALPGAPQSGRLMLPTGVYPVPQPEPHFAQMPSASPSPSPCGVYPSLAKESHRQQPHVPPNDRGGEIGMEEWRDGGIVAVENGYQSNPPLSPSYAHLSSTSTSPIPTQHKSPNQKANRPSLEDLRASGERTETQGVQLRPQNHHEPHGQTFQGPHIHSSPGSQTQTSQGPQGQALPGHQSHLTQGPPNQTSYGHYIHTSSQGPQTQHSLGPQTNFNQVYRPSSAQHMNQERRDPYTPVQHRRSSVPLETLIPAQEAQGQAPAMAPPPHPQPQAVLQPDEPRHPAPHRHHSDTSALQQQRWDQREMEREREREHPLTRLENALAEVQRCASPDATAGGQGSGSSHGAHRSLSVLEKISRFERRDHGGKQRSHSTSHGHSWLNQAKPQERAKSVFCGSEDIRTMLERSTNGTKVQRTVSCRRDRSEQPQFRHPADPSSALLRSQSTYHLGDPAKEFSGREFPRKQDLPPEESGRDFPWKQDLQDLLGSIQDTSYNRAYRDSLKDAQSKVLRSTSFRRRDLSVSVSPPPTGAPPPVAASSANHSPTSHGHQPPATPARNLSLERKGPKTMPKPQGVFPMVPPPSPTALPTSCHTPRERHVVSPEVRGPSPPALPSVPPVGPVPLTRICGRKRLTMEQKKRSYSEPDNMHEVGVSDAETTALFRRGETSVADRRRMFELAASRSVGAAPSQNAVSRPDLRQMQQDALAEYVERKRGKRKEDGGGGGGRPQRPHSAYIQPGTNTAPSPYPDTLSLSSTSSLLSLQDPFPERSFSAGERRLCSTLPPGTDLQSNLFYPGRVTAPRPQPSIHHTQSPHPGSYPEPQGPVPTTTHRFHSEDGLLYGQQQQTPGPEWSQGPPQHLNGAFERSGPGRSSGKSASAEDLLERSEERQPAPQHHRSRSSPAVERHVQEGRSGDLRMFGIFSTEQELFPFTDNRPTESPKKDRPTSATTFPSQHFSVGPVQPRPSPSQANNPVARRERLRNGDRQRAQSTSTLAASVGLPCPLSPAGAHGNANADWQASERLSQANLDAITFPGLPQNSGGGDGNAGGTDVPGEGKERRSSQAGRKVSSSSTENLEKQESLHPSAEQSLSDTGPSGDALKDLAGEKELGVETGKEDGAEVAGKASPKTPGPQATASSQRDSEGSPSPPLPLSSPPAAMQHLSSLRISESSLCPSVSQPEFGQSQEEFDEVFLQEPLPPPPPPPTRETEITEDLPPPPSFTPPPPTQTSEQEQAGCYEQERKNSLELLDTPQRRSSLHHLPSASSSSSSPSPSPMPSLPSEPQLLATPPAATSVTTPSPETQEAEPIVELEYHPLPRRERSAAELRVEALSKQLVLRDRTLTPLLDTWSGKSTVDLMEDIFPSAGLAGRSARQHRGSVQLADGVQDQNQDAIHGLETDLDEEETDLNTTKVGLCEALRQSVICLREEKETLAEEQKTYRALGSTMDTLVQDHCKSNERDKYRMFMGDLEKMVNLLLSLCGRLARIDKALLALDSEDQTEDNTGEKDALQHKRTQLLNQTEDAKELKEHLDRRQRTVHTILSGCLTAPQLHDYQRLVGVKPTLLIRQRQLDDLIRQGEDQLARLAESLPPELAEACAWPNGCSTLSSPAPSPCPGQSPSPAPSLISGHSQSVRSTTVTSL